MLNALFLPFFCFSLPFPIEDGRLPEQQDRISRIETRQWEQQEQISKIESRMSSLETSRDNERTRHATTPAWLFGVLSVGLALVTLLLNLYLAGLRP